MKVLFVIGFSLPFRIKVSPMTDCKWPSIRDSEGPSFKMYGSAYIF